MKCIILLSLVALCYSYPYGTGFGMGYGYGMGSGKNFNVNADGSITVATANGKMITITKGIGQNVVVSVADPDVSGNQYYFGYQKHQPDTLAQILSQYQGDINQNTYQQLLGDVDSAVQDGQLGNAIYEALQNLNQVGQIQGQVFGGQVGQQQWQALKQAQQVQQLLQQQAQNQWNQQGLQVPYGQTTGNVQGVVVPVGVSQQGQIVEKLLLQNPQIGYPYSVGPISGHQGVFGQQSFGGNSAWNTLINNILYGRGQQQNPHQYGQYQVGPVGQTGQLLQVEGEILNQQNQIHQGQMQQQQQQQQMLHQQFHHQQQQQQLQGQQQYVQELQEQVQKEQQHVLGQQEQVQEQQKYNTWMNLLSGTKPLIQTVGQQTGSWQQQPGVYSQGGLNVFGQGLHHNIPLVF
ncbi:adenylate cyclase, terminal-differentiation specific [Anoplophora glabripennis]|uniref:adenylate cyclase, terminal-differentiation specific n=1 Tax=Anoplophora glabripennis TaxID=217634 RepID=UPI0008758F38|nr:adenylate cyclase, terminal-differentiation specific [Anoplophora glabripennis]